MTMVKTVLLDVELTEDDIKRGKRHCYLACPLALALSRAASEAAGIKVHAIVSHYTCVFFLGGHDSEVCTVGLPKWVRVFVDRFDNREPVKPRRFRAGVWLPSDTASIVAGGTIDGDTVLGHVPDREAVPA